MMGEYDAGYENCINGMVKQMEDMQFRIDNLHRENAKLRELVRGLWWCTESPDGPRVDCEHCPLGAVEGEPWQLVCENMMRELGIEVD